jgi:hypothetical protein
MEIISESALIAVAHISSTQFHRHSYWADDSDALHSTAILVGQMIQMLCILQPFLLGR